MKQIITLFCALLLCNLAFSQNSVTKFLGIPIDGTKASMQQKLIAKGFVYNKASDCLTGEFNGRDVNLHIVTNNNKVYRIMVADKTPSTESNIRVRFNTLCRQFENNGKYIPQNFGLEKYQIDEDEDFGYEMLVNNKRYEASYFQIPENVDTLAIQAQLFGLLKEKYTDEQIHNPTPEITQDIMSMTIDLMIQYYSPRSVWFMIDRDYGDYRILMYYDNEFNHANGEDL